MSSECRGPCAQTCRLCGDPGPFPALLTVGGYQLVRCPVCTLTFVHPQPTEGVLEAAYYHNPWFTEALFGELRAWTVEQAELHDRLLARVAPMRPGRLLDVGCSSGAWLEVAERAGWDATGIELGAMTAEEARRHGLDVRTGTLSEVAPSLEEASFDLITFWDVLEHVRDPNVELEAALPLLRPGGRLAVSCPNVAGLLPRLTFQLCARPLGIWEHPEPPMHLYEFSVATLEALLRRHGLVAVGHTTTTIPLTYLLGVTLGADRIGSGRRARAARRLVSLLHRATSPLASLTDRGNAALVVVERRPGSVR